MSGQQTHGYDLVVEFAEQAYQELLSVVFDTGGFLLGTILGGLGINLDPATPFSVTVSFDQPGGLPAGATDVVDIRVLLGNAGALGSLRIVASVDVDTSTNGIDLVRIDLAQKLWLTEIDVAGHPDPGSQRAVRHVSPAERQTLSPGALPRRPRHQHQHPDEERRRAHHRRHVTAG